MLCPSTYTTSAHLQASGHIPSYPIAPNAVNRLTGLLHPCGVVLFEGHFGVDPDSEPLRGVLIELDVVVSDPHRFRSFLPLLWQEHGHGLGLVEGDPILPCPV